MDSSTAMQGIIWLVAGGAMYLFLRRRRVAEPGRSAMVSSQRSAVAGRESGARIGQPSGLRRPGSCFGEKSAVRSENRLNRQDY